MLHFIKSCSVISKLKKRRDSLNKSYIRGVRDSYSDMFNEVCVTSVCRSHLAQNPFICDCHLKWLADYLQDNPIETSGARCTSPRRLANKRIGQIKSKKFRCSGTNRGIITLLVFTCPMCSFCLFLLGFSPQTLFTNLLSSF